MFNGLARPECVPIEPGCRMCLGEIRPSDQSERASSANSDNFGGNAGEIAVIKILLVEDDADVLDLTAYVLRRERFVVVEASDGAQALRRLKADRPDIVVLDLGLPLLDGFEVIRRIRAESDTPILVMTGRKEAQDVLRSFN